MKIKNTIALGLCAFIQGQLFAAPGDFLKAALDTTVSDAAYRKALDGALASGASAFETDEYGNDTVMKLLIIGRASDNKLQILLDEYGLAKSINTENNSGQTKLLAAIEGSMHNSAYADIVSLLIKGGADPEQRGYISATYAAINPTTGGSIRETPMEFVNRTNAAVRNSVIEAVKSIYR